jgi:quinoprotein glucose dehydrogenase
VLNRETGEPVFGVEERPVPQTGAEEPISATQPFPLKPPPLSPLTFEPWGLTPWDRGRCEDALAGMRFDGIYTPPGADWSITYPAPIGGVNWGGVAVDPATKRLYVNTADIPLKVRLLPRADYEEQKAAGFDVSTSPQTGTPFAIQREPWIEVIAPCNPPPWGRISAVDLIEGEIIWEQPFAKLRDFTPIPLDIGVGMPSLGGPLVTGGGLIFIGAAPGHWLRAFDRENGEEIWRGALPAGANASPMTYQVRGDDGTTRQFVVVAAGGHWAFHDLGDILGDTLVAFALPRN